MVRKSVFLFLVLLLFASSVSAGVDKIRDEPRQVTLYRQMVQTRSDKQDTRYRFADYIGFNVVKEIADSTKDSALYILIKVFATDGLSIVRGDTLELVIDDNPYYLKCTRLWDYKQVFRKITLSGLPGQTTYLETPIYNVDRAFLYKLAESHKILIDLYGRNRHFKGAITSTGISNIRDFCKKCVKNTDNPESTKGKQ